MPEIRDQVVVITGATGDIGKALALRLARDGAKLAITGRDPEKVAALETAIAELGATVVGGAVDITVEAQVAEFFAKARAALGKLDTLVNCPGLSIPSQIPAARVEDFETMFNVNVKGLFLAAKHFIGQLDEAAGGLVMNVSSVAGKRANPNAPLYCAAKAAANMLTEGLALQTAAKNVRVTTLSPGAVDTQFWGTRQVPRHKFLTVDDVAEVIRFVLGMPARIVFHDIAFESFEFLRSK